MLLGKGRGDPSIPSAPPLPTTLLTTNDHPQIHSRILLAENRGNLNTPLAPPLHAPQPTTNYFQPVVLSGTLLRKSGGYPTTSKAVSVGVAILRRKRSKTSTMRKARIPLLRPTSDALRACPGLHQKPGTRTLHHPPRLSQLRRSRGMYCTMIPGVEHPGDQPLLKARITTQRHLILSPTPDLALNSPPGCLKGPQPPATARGSTLNSALEDMERPPFRHGN